MKNPYKKIQIPIGYEDIRMFEELADGHREPFTWTFDEIDVEFIKDDEEDEDRVEDILKGRDEAMQSFTNKLNEKESNEK